MKTKITLICLLLIVISAKAIGNDTIKIVLLAGQSNMGGAGSFEELDFNTKSQIKEVSKRVKVLSNSNIAKPLSYERSKHHLKKYGFEKYFGPEMFIGLDLASKYPDQEFILIKRSQGGTSLYGAWNPNWDKDKAQLAENKDFKRKLKLYESHLAMIQFCVDSLTNIGKIPVIVGTCWMQGENDAAIEVCAVNYKKNLEALISKYRNYTTNPEMPFVIGQINSTYGRFKEGPELVRKSMEEVAASDKYVGIVKTSTDPSWSDYPKHSDNTHYNTKGQKRLGKAFASELMKYL